MLRGYCSSALGIHVLSYLSVPKLSTPLVLLFYLRFAPLSEISLEKVTESAV